jgi:hypothetical protein
VEFFWGQFSAELLLEMVLPGLELLMVAGLASSPRSTVTTITDLVFARARDLSQMGFGWCFFGGQFLDLGECSLLGRCDLLE